MKYSKQRELILDYINNSYDHPTALMVYEKVKEDIPNISLGTVYRNLNLLVELGKILKITTPDDKVNFDKIINPHNHIYCKKCKKLYDISNEKFKSIEKKIEEETGHIIDSSSTILVGICNNCLNDERKEE